MKKIKYIFLLFLGLAVLLACKKEDKEPVLDMSQSVVQAFTSPASGDVFVLDKELVDSLLTTFKWSAATYNLTNLEATTYKLEMDFADSNFMNVRNLVSTTTTEFPVTVGEMNKELIAMGAVADVPVNVAFRLFSYVNNDTEYSDLNSGVITLNITPYADVVTYPSLWVPGDYQGWDPAGAPQIYDFDGDGVYTGYIYFPEDAASFEFKFTSQPDWDGINYGDGGEGVLDVDAGAGNLSVPAAGGYQVEVDVNNLSWTYLAQSWGVIGEWLAWAEDIDLEWDADNQYLIKTVEGIPAAENQRFKYRADDDWAVNLGAKDPDDGTLVQGGADIPIPDGGTITFILRFTTPEPTYELQKK
jgi:hypothetical protein